MRDAFFLDTPDGPRFALHYRGAKAIPPLLILPPFAEELNKSRRQIAKFAEAAQALGMGVLCLDLYGTGDSPGDFGDAALPDWQADIAHAQAWLSARYDALPAALAIRQGCLLAGQTAFSSVLVWAAVLSGEAWLNGMLRLRVMASRLAGGHESAAALLQEAADSGHTEVAGYRLSQSLIETARQARCSGFQSPRIRLLDSLPGQQPPPALRSFLEATGAGWESLEGPSFWQTLETEVHAGLISAGLAWLADRRPREN